MHACADDGLQELLYPRSVRELLLDQTPSWEILQQTAGISSKGFAFPLGQDDNMETMHGLGPDMKPSSQLPTLPYTHDDRLSSSTASSTLTDGTQLSGVEQWPVAHSEPIQARSSSMRVSHTSILRQFDPARVKQEYASPLSGATSFHHPGNKPTMSSFLLQQQPHHHNMRIINPSHEQAALLNEANIGTNPDIKPCKQLSSWQGSVVVGPIADDQCRPSPSFELSNLPANMSGDTHQMLLNSLKQHQNHLDSAAFAGTPHLRAQESTFLHQDHQQRHQIMQQAGIHMHHPLANSILNASIGMHQFPSGLKKTRAHTERLGANQSGLLSSMEEVDIKGRDQKSAVPPHEDYNLKRPRIDSAGHQQPPGQVQQTAAASSPSFKSQPPRKEKLADRITTLQQLVSPFGKTDTASVLLEAIGYIKFLQEQVQTLSSPYLKSTNIQTAHNGEKNPNGEEAKPDLRSKGLCLVPLSCTMQVANDNAADYWLGGTYR
ncbi:hypothetical protein KP509_32G034500 [Ceratopteris richardii]|nr:hypothetical protein KP509_32G034500 [Ceratopteris richardii]